MRRRNRPPRTERPTKSGELLLSHNHLALLHGLLDRPSGIASSYADWLVRPAARRAFPAVAEPLMFTPRR